MDRQQILDIAEFPVQRLLKIVVNLLDSIIATNDRLPSTRITHFHSRSVPNISLHDYLTRILKFAPFTNEVLLSLLVYFDRIAKLENNTFAVNSLNIHRLLITSITVASKFTSDVFYPNSRYAKVGGISLGELNQLELEFLFLCNFELHVRLEDLQAYGNQLLTHAMSQQPSLLTSDIPIPTQSVAPVRSFSSEGNPARSSQHQIHPLTPPYDPPTCTNDTQPLIRPTCKKFRRIRSHPYARHKPLGVLLSPKE